jgi:hypothetical protein
VQGKEKRRRAFKISDEIMETFGIAHLKKHIRTVFRREKQGSPVQGHS